MWIWQIEAACYYRRNETNERRRSLAVLDLVDKRACEAGQ